MKPNTQLKYEREIRGWSQAKVAEEIGSSDRNVSRWERGVSSPYPHFREKLCALFGKSAHELGFVETNSERVQQDDTFNSKEQELALPQLRDPTIPPLSEDSGELVGRDTLLAQLLERLCSGKNIALSGLPGVGKTALAVSLVYHNRIHTTFSDGVLWAGLGPHPNVLGQMSRWGTLLGLSSPDLLQESSIDAWAVAMHTAIGKRHMLLVLDDVWEIESALPFKVGGPNCTVLVTTRFPGIALRLAQDGAIVVRELSAEYGLQLLTRLAPEVVEHDTLAAQTLVQEVGGLPLALTLMGKYLRVQAHSGQPRRLRTAIARLRDMPNRLQLSELQPPIERSPYLAAGTPLSLQSAIAVSDQRLDEHTRIALRVLSVFPAKPNTFSEEAALAVTQMPVEVLDTLADAGLLESSGPNRYMLHQTIADYASTHLTETSAGERLVAYMLSYAESHASDYIALEQESNNVLAALKYAFASGHHVKFVRVVNAFAPFLLARGLYDMATLHLQRAYQTALWSHDMQGVAKVLLHLGTVAYQRGEYAQAEVHTREGLTIARGIGNYESICTLLALLEAIGRQLGDHTQAEEALQEGLHLARQTGLLTMMSNVRDWLETLPKYPFL